MQTASTVVTLILGVTQLGHDARDRALSVTGVLELGEQAGPPGLLGSCGMLCSAASSLARKAAAIAVSQTLPWPYSSSR